MTPSFTKNNRSNIRHGDSVFSGEHVGSHFARFIYGSYLFYLLFSEFCSGMIFAKSVSSFQDFIVHVIDVCPKPKMFGVDAQSVVTVMKNMQFIGNAFSFKNPSDAMGRVLFPAADKIAVTPSRFGPVPIPAGFSFIDVFPKSIFKFMNVVIQNTFIVVLHCRDSFLNAVSAIALNAMRSYNMIVVM